MVLKVTPVSLKERDELEPMLIAQPDTIEQGLRVLAHQHPSDSGPIDILAVDVEETLVIIELKNEASEGHLDQGLRYYDWCRENLAWISSAYGPKYHINAEAAPRLILIAPSFTDSVRRIAKYIDVELQLIEYQAFEDPNHQRGIVCKEIDFGQPPEPPSIPSLEKKLEWFKDNKVKELFKSALSELEQRNVEVRPIHGLWVSFWYAGKRFMYMAPKRNFFVANILHPGGAWSGRKRIATTDDWNEVRTNEIEKFLRHLDGESSARSA